MADPQAPARAGTVRLFQFHGIAVFLHWTWFIVAVYEIGERTGSYSSIIWNVAEYVALFGIVTLHEFGHAFACRSVGGRADRIVLWPLGGIAFVDPPPRPGATLWSIAAGPLVNVALLPVLAGLALATSGPSASDVHALLRNVTFINAGLLLFNVLPIYPLDGGQILGALLWFAIGRARSLMVSAAIGLVGVIGIAWLAFSSGSAWLGLMAFFLAGQCLNGVRAARALGYLANAPRRDGFACPSCKARPPAGPFWRCGACGTGFDVFEPEAHAPRVFGRTFETTTRLDLSAAPAAPDAREMPGRCPACHEPAAARCPQCGAIWLVSDWRAAAVAEAQPPNAHAVVRARRPRPPSMVPVALGVCISVVAVVFFLTTLLCLNVSFRLSTASEASGRRGAAIAAFTIALLLMAAALWQLVRYRVSRKAFASALQRFDEGRDLSAAPF